MGRRNISPPPPSSSPLCRVFTLIFLRQTMSLGNSVAAILLLLFMLHRSLAPVLNLLYFYISTFQSMCAVPSMAVFCSSLTSWFPGMLLDAFSEWLWNGPCHPYYYWYHIHFYIPHALYFYCKVLIFQNLLGFFFFSHHHHVFLAPVLAPHIILVSLTHISHSDFPCPEIHVEKALTHCTCITDIVHRGRHA